MFNSNLAIHYLHFLNINTKISHTLQDTSQKIRGKMEYFEAKLIVTIYNNLKLV